MATQREGWNLDDLDGAAPASVRRRMRTVHRFVNLRRTGVEFCDRSFDMTE